MPQYDKQGGSPRVVARVDPAIKAWTMQPHVNTSATVNEALRQYIERVDPRDDPLSHFKLVDEDDAKATTDATTSDADEQADE